MFKFFFSFLVFPISPRNERYDTHTLPFSMPPDYSRSFAAQRESCSHHLQTGFDFVLSRLFFFVSFWWLLPSCCTNKPVMQLPKFRVLFLQSVLDRRHERPKNSAKAIAISARHSRVCQLLHFPAKQFREWDSVSHQFECNCRNCRKNRGRKNRLARLQIYVEWGWASGARRERVAARSHWSRRHRN